jgi:hypothetical protein
LSVSIQSRRSHSAAIASPSSNKPTTNILNNFFIRLMNLKSKIIFLHNRDIVWGFPLQKQKKIGKLEAHCLYTKQNHLTYFNFKYGFVI